MLQSLLKRSTANNVVFCFLFNIRLHRWADVILAPMIVLDSTNLHSSTPYFAANPQWLGSSTLFMSFLGLF
jgi:hypothetical protein